ncbi:hypothetical protein C1645_814059 [Glomus cerebriforme]|uniref:F-box domain-containing protein n=1 Tax=Glomus cerebriforme TaxID=658196 RepID=A0A397TGW2_9GLOM|nr:hypothetical protein C1645_814059 [Glomus cerebriforme]
MGLRSSKLTKPRTSKTREINETTPLKITKITHNIPIEIIEEIFYYLEDDISALYYCILINRYFCSKLLPILWSNPLKNLSINNHLKNLNYINLYISLFNEEETNIFLLKNEEQNKIIKQLQKNLFDIKKNLKPPLFNYIRYLKEFDYPKLKKATTYWIVSNEYLPKEGLDFKFKCVRNNLLRALCSLAFRSSNLSLLCLFYKTHLPSFIREPSNFENVKSISLKIDYNRHMTNGVYEFIKSLPQCCKKLQHVSLDITYVGFTIIHDLALLIKVQNNLKYLKISQNIDSFGDSLINHIILAIESQARTLTSLIFKDIENKILVIEILSKCSNLKNLEFFDEVIKKEKLSIKKGVPFSLESLKLINQQEDLVSYLISFGGGNQLTSLWLDVVDENILKSILKTSMNITHLRLSISNIYKESNLKDYLRLIGSLNLIYLGLYLNKLYIYNKMFIQMASIIPDTLKVLELVNQFKPLIIKEFLEKIDISLEKLILIPNIPNSYGNKKRYSYFKNFLQFATSFNITVSKLILKYDNFNKLDIDKELKLELQNYYQIEYLDLNNEL